jgi:hypothetical protein
VPQKVKVLLTADRRNRSEPSPQLCPRNEAQRCKDVFCSSEHELIDCPNTTMASSKDLTSITMVPDTVEVPLEIRKENSTFWLLLVDILLFAAAELLFSKWDESVQGPWYPKGWLFVIVIFFLIFLI